VTESLLLTLGVIKSSSNISVGTEVWHKVILSIADWSWLERGSHGVSEGLLSFTHVFVSDGNVSFEFTEVGSSDIWWTWGLLEGSRIVLNTESLFLASNMSLGSDDILVDSEVWNEIIMRELNLWLLWWRFVPWGSSGSVWSKLNVGVIVWCVSEGSDIITQEKGENK